MQIIKVKNGAYEEYEMLLLSRDQYRKEAMQILITYSKRFGDQINAVFEKQIQCIRLKKTIELCQAALNRGEAIDLDKVNGRIAAEMKAYYKQLEEMLADSRAAKESRAVPAVTILEIKRIYRKLAKLIHPDINPESIKSPELNDLWNRITIAYQNNNLKELQELEVLTLKAIEQLDKDVEIDIPNLEEKIIGLQREIDMITGTTPYTYKTILEDADKCRQKDHDLKTQFDEYEKYSQELQGILDGMFTREGRKITWRMNLH